MENWYLINQLDVYNKINTDKLTNFQKMIIANRGISSQSQVNIFISHDMNNMHNPLLMKDMKLSIDILFSAIMGDEKIRVVGDYDQDGVSATAILIKGIKDFYDKITYTIPDRIEDGYGINKKIIDECIKDDIKLIITCDNGISAIEPIDYARENGIKVIVTDHHQPIILNGEELLPNANAIVNPHQVDCTYPFKGICGAMVAYKFIEAIHQVYGNQIALDKNIFIELIQLATLGTVCDMMEIIDENRVLVIEGLKKINESPLKGLITLLEIRDLSFPINMYTIGFIIGPTINASGRIYTANLGVELFLEEDEETRKEYAKILIDLNEKRKQMTINGEKSAIKTINTQKLYKDDIIVVYDKSIHESICGLVAGKVKEKYNKPTLVLTYSENKNFLKGSGRSIKAYDMYGELNKYRSNYISFGGHTMACGISFREDYLDEFRKKINDESKLSSKDFRKEVEIDYSLSFSQINEKIIEEKDELRPYGFGFSEPIFATKNVVVKVVDIIGKNQNVVKLVLEKDNKRLQAISFDIEYFYKVFFDKYGVKDTLTIKNLENKKIDIAYRLNINEYNSYRNIQLVIVSMR